jgi:RNA polymerase sigma-70 factor, ECF subfamily
MRPWPGNAFHGITGNEHAGGPDLELVAAAKLGSNEAFEQLQSRYSSRLYRRIQSITRNHEDAEDALQETFLRAYLALDSFEGRSQFASWLTSIAINSALMLLRRRRTRAEVSFELTVDLDEPDLTFDVRDAALNPEQLYDLRQRTDYALRAVSKLNVKLRTPLKTWVQKDCSMKEVARTLDLSLATVKARLHRARKQLTRSQALSERMTRAGSTSGSSLQCLIPDIQNRELPCASFD